MIDRGYYQMHRGWQDHPVFGNAPYDERGAWEWLIAHAAHGTTTVAVNGSPVTVERGQLCYSVRFLAERWKWSKSRVHRFLQKFARWDMIQTCSKTGTDSGTAITLITICNYELYQTPQKKAGQQAGQERDRSGTNKKNDKNDKKETTLSGRAPDPVQQVFQHWQEVSGHQRSTLTKDRRAKIKARLRSYSARDLCSAIENACADPFMQGDNDRQTRYDFPETILKTDAKVDQWLSKNAKKPQLRLVVND